MGLTDLFKKRPAGDGRDSAGWYTLLLSTGVLLLSCAPPESPSEMRESVLRQITQNQEWMSETKQCPADLMPIRETPIGEDDCNPPRLRACMMSCMGGDGGACFWLAYALQQSKAPEQSYEALYQRSCKLGIVSGCTNRAAGILSADKSESSQACAARTFQKTCEHDDPWGCTMYALHLSQGWGIPKDTRLALHVLEKSCKHGPEDEACTRGMEIRDRLLEAK